MIVLFTDFGLEGPYIGQMQAVLHREAPGVPVINLSADAPRFDPRAGAYLLAAYTSAFPDDSVFLCVVDPGVGGARAPLVLQTGRSWYVGPDNGLLAVAAKRAAAAQAWRITWRPQRLSASFHGRDLFSPVAATLGRGEPPPGEPLALDSLAGWDWPEDLGQVIYVDGFGNVMTGLRAGGLAPDASLSAGARSLGRARTFSDVAPGEAFWYENANGLAEIAVNQGRADDALGLGIGDPVEVVS